MKTSLWRLIASASAFVLIGTAAAASISGFKDLEFGMTHNQLRAIGIDDCIEAEFNICRLKDKERTLLGKVADVSITMFEGRLLQIDAWIDVPCDQVIPELSVTFGQVITFEYTALMGGRATQYFWLTDNGTSLSIAIAPPVYSAARCSVSYRDEGSTLGILDRYKESQLDPSDL
ncbi:hypothetical protein [Thiocapsa marina]|uniref:hypothetical protein n=1 Tax=Thiocapsa marina TaxID=244573 RepID=UPI0011119838|nr:hypothetical protein [Thiocapsa marina]